MKRKYFLNIIVLIFCVQNFSFGQSNQDTIKTISSADREFRAAWVATVANINWPSEPGLTEEKQKEEALLLLDLLQKCNYNAVVFQVRPQADALYESDLEPWSYYLTGSQGEAPCGFYDPLEFWIEEAHKRCIELHAWINPYRAHHTEGSIVSENSIVKQKPDIVVELKNGYWWFDPSLKETQDHSYSVVMDIVDRYDIDGIHFDDYFYPYPDYNEGEDFPDHKSWQNYLDEGGSLSRDNWRRHNVNVFVERVYDGIKAAKPHVKFGLSPFGIWRPNHPKSITGFDQYSVLYADAKLWLNKGWVDYWTPQLYWTINDIEQSFPVLLGWWKTQNLMNRHFWPGVRLSWGSDETINQIMVARGMLSESPGIVHWSIAPLITDSTLAQDLVNGPFKKQALVPDSPWLNNKIPEPPTADINIDDDNLCIEPIIENDDSIRQWVLYYNYGEEWNYKILSLNEDECIIPIFTLSDIGQLAATATNLELQTPDTIKAIGISAVNIFGTESEINEIIITEDFFDDN